MHAWTKTMFGAVSDQYLCRILPIKILTNASKPWGACMTELGCSSSSDLGFNASFAAFDVSSYHSVSILLLCRCSGCTFGNASAVCGG